MSVALYVLGVFTSIASQWDSSPLSSCLHIMKGIVSARLVRPDTRRIIYQSYLGLVARKSWSWQALMDANLGAGRIGWVLCKGYGLDTQFQLILFAFMRTWLVAVVCFLVKSFISGLFDGEFCIYSDFGCS